MTRFVPLLAALTAAALLTAGCTSGDDPKPNYSSVSSTPTSTSPTPTASPSPTGFPTTGPNVNPGEVPPTEPATANADDSGGGISFAAYYVKTLDWVFATSKPDILTPFYSPTCTTCQNRLKYLHSIFDGGGSLRGGRLIINKAEVVTNDGRLGATLAVSTAVSVGAAVVIGAGGAPATSAAPSPGITLTTWLSWQNSRWQIVEEGYA